MLNDKIFKKFNKKMTQKWAKSTRFNPLSIIIESWDRDNLIKNKSKQIMKSNFQSNTILNDEFGGGESIKNKKNIESIGLTQQTRNPSYEMGITQ